MSKIYWFNFIGFQWDKIINLPWFKEIYEICARAHILRQISYSEKARQLLNQENIGIYLFMIYMILIILRYPEQIYWISNTIEDVEN